MGPEIRSRVSGPSESTRGSMVPWNRLGRSSTRAWRLRGRGSPEFDVNKDCESARTEVLFGRGTTSGERLPGTDHGKRHEDDARGDGILWDGRRTLAPPRVVRPVTDTRWDLARAEVGARGPCGDSQCNDRGCRGWFGVVWVRRRGRRPLTHQSSERAVAGCLAALAATNPPPALAREKP